ncbi:HAMP domain-containing protein [Pectobacterium parvum]|uniref:HAMP domain-containing protein n=1 Tax=Pectobacterium parvum TaxID=2778550 RepID=UPI001FDA8D04|nr:HAMP domain-containing protein [Pectobacterium parvum]
MGQDISAGASRGDLILAITGVLSAIIGVLIAWILTRSIVQPLAHAVRATQAVAAGDLTHNVQPEGRDEAAQLLHALQDMTYVCALSLAKFVRVPNPSLAHLHSLPQAISTFPAVQKNKPARYRKPQRPLSS